MLNRVGSPALQDVEGKQRAFRGETIQLRVLTQISKLKLQCRPDATVDLDELAEITCTGLPTSADTAANTTHSIYWLAPNEWLLVSAEYDPQVLDTIISEHLASQAHAITDLSDSLEIIEISGEKSRELLSEGCGVDFHEDAFHKGKYVQTKLCQLAVLIHQTGDEPIFRIYVDRSFALYLWDWLVDGGRQFVSKKD